MSEDYKSRRTYKYGEFTITSTTLNSPQEKIDEVAATLRKILTKPKKEETKIDQSKKPL